MCGLETLVLWNGMHKGLIGYHKTNGIKSVKKHVEVESKVLFNIYVESIHSYVKGLLE
jgi:hypothetical protein